MHSFWGRLPSGLDHTSPHELYLCQVFANENDDAFFTDGHLMAEERLVLLSDGVGDITAVDLRTSKQVKCPNGHRSCIRNLLRYGKSRIFLSTEGNCCMLTYLVRSMLPAEAMSSSTLEL